ncbi:MAG TPA: AraC family transcriptional regulator [Jiangellaceae bacterium]|nr:AraC family transcriptional regulator [Jiangellaceae bacterium]
MCDDGLGVADLDSLPVARMSRATDLSVADVAGRVGYRSPFAFSHAFRVSYGPPPLRYRRAASQVR